MNKVLYNIINSFFNLIGLEVRRYPSRDMKRLLNYLTRNQVNTCFDVGANIGQYAHLIRSSGFNGDIWSFEPQAYAFSVLKKKARQNKRWSTFHFAFGDFDGSSEMNISKNSASSSILDFEESNVSVNAAPESVFVSKEQINVRRIDSFLKEKEFGGRIFLKIDAQGFEEKILSGLGEYWKQIYALQLELSCVPVYKGEKLFDEMKAFIESRGFFLSSIESNFADFQSGRLLQVEAIFLKDVEFSQK